MAADGFFLTGAATRVAAGAMARTAAIASECASTISVTGRPRSGKAIDENNHTPFVLWHSGIQIASSGYGSTSTVTMGNRKCCLPGVGWLVSASCLSFGLKNGSLNHIVAVLTQICKCWDSVSENRIIRRAKIGSLHFLPVLLEWPHTFLSEHVAPVFAHRIPTFTFSLLRKPCINRRTGKIYSLARRARSKKFFSGQHAMLLKRRCSTSHRPDGQCHIPDAEKRSHATFPRRC